MTRCIAALLLALLPLAAQAAEAPSVGGKPGTGGSTSGTVSVAPSGGDDTAALQSACTKGAVQLSAGVYHVTAITCKAITGLVNAEDFFWYEGQQPTVKMIGSPAGKRGVVTCPSPGPCTYASFAISPPAGTAGIVLDSVHGASLLNMNVVDDQGGASASCVDMNRTSEDNQNIFVQGGTYIHCGGWCFDASEGGTSDTQWIGVDIANCRLGGIHVAYGYGIRLTGNYIQGGFASSGFVWDCCGDGNVVGNHFDENQSDMVLGGNGGVYLSVSGNSSCRTQGGAMFDIVSAYIHAAANMSCGPTYIVRPGGSVGGGFYDPAPSYGTPDTQAAMAALIR